MILHINEAEQKMLLRLLSYAKQQVGVDMRATKAAGLTGPADVMAAGIALVEGLERKLRDAG